MPTFQAPPAKGAAKHPSGDKRFKLLEVAMKRHQFRPDALIEVLHAAQQLFGYLELDLLLFIARHLKLPPSRVYGVATFYHLFTLKPTGKHTCVVCTGTACYVKGADRLLAVLKQQAGVGPGETTADGEFTLRAVECLGGCSTPTIVAVDHVYRQSVKPEDVPAILSELGDE